MVHGAPVEGEAPKQRLEIMVAISCVWLPTKGQWHSAVHTGQPVQGLGGRDVDGERARGMCPRYIQFSVGGKTMDLCCIRQPLSVHVGM